MNNGKITIGMDCIGLGVGAVIMNDLGEVLLMKRSKNLSKDRTTAGLWSIPGGEVEFGEKVSDAIKREVREELDVEIVVKKIIGNWDQILPKSKVHWHSVSFLCKIKNGVPKIMEPDKFNQIKWFSLSKIPENSGIAHVAVPLYLLGKMNKKEFERRIRKTAES